MKKLILSVAIVLGGLTAMNAQSDQAKTLSNSSAKASMSSEVIQDYKEVKTSEVPQNVLASLSKTYDGVSVSKAYVNERGEYKLELTTADKKTATVYTNGKGEVVKNELSTQ